MCLGKQVEEQESQEEAGQVKRTSLPHIGSHLFFFPFAGVCVVHVHVLLPVWKVAERTLYRELFSVLVRKP